jgi:hypothetical protein
MLEGSEVEHVPQMIEEESGEGMGSNEPQSQNSIFNAKRRIDFLQRPINGI